MQISKLNKELISVWEEKTHEIDLMDARGFGVLGESNDE